MNKNIKNRVLKVVEQVAPPAPAAAVVTVRANGWIAEEINGKMQTFKPGESFTVPAARVPALGNLVTVAKE